MTLDLYSYWAISLILSKWTDLKKYNISFLKKNVVNLYCVPSTVLDAGDVKVDIL